MDDLHRDPVSHGFSSVTELLLSTMVLTLDFKQNCVSEIFLAGNVLWQKKLCMPSLPKIDFPFC